MSPVFQRMVRAWRAAWSLTTPADRAIWNELAALDNARYTRLEARFGTCPICRGGATAAFPDGAHTSAVCGPCGVTWPTAEVMEAPIVDAEWLDAITRVPSECAPCTATTRRGSNATGDSL